MTGLVRGGTNISHAGHLGGMVAGIYLADVYVEYFKKLQRGPEPDILFRLAKILYGRKQLFSAASALELILKAENVDDKLREKALYQVGNIMAELEYTDAAEMYYEQFLEHFPTSVFASKVRGKLRLSFS